MSAERQQTLPLVAAVDDSAHFAASGFSSGRRKLALGVVALAFVMDLLDTTIVNIAVPSIQGSLHATTATVEWLIAGYALAFSLLLITGGRLGDTYGYKRLFLAGVGGFAFASLLCGIAWSSNALIVARVLQGMAAAMMVPQVLALMQIMYKPHERVQVQALFGLMGGTSAALGPVLGAFLIRSNIFGLGWRPIFLINLPVALIALIAGQKALPSGRSTHPMLPDLPGAAFLTVILFLIMFPLLEGSSLGWPWYIFASIAVALALVPLFVRYLKWKQAHDESPLLMPEIFHDRAFSIGLVVSFLFNMGISGYLLFFTLTVQIGLGLGVLMSGLYCAPFAIGVLLSLGLVGRRFVPLLGRKMLPLGAAIMAISMVTMAMLLPDSPPLHGFALAIAIPQLTAGIGLGTFLAAMSPIILSNVEVRYAGIAAGVMNSSQQFCGALGIAVVGGIFFSLLAHGVDRQVVLAAPRLQSVQAVLPHGQAPAQASIAARLHACSYAELRLNGERKIAGALPACSPEDVQAPAGIPDADRQMVHQAAIVRTATYRWAFRRTILLELLLLFSSALLSFALPKDLKIFDGPVAH